MCITVGCFENRKYFTDIGCFFRTLLNAIRFYAIIPPLMTFFYILKSMNDRILFFSRWNKRCNTEAYQWLKTDGKLTLASLLRFVQLSNILYARLQKVLPRISTTHFLLFKRWLCTRVSYASLKVELHLDAQTRNGQPLRRKLNLHE